jgi:hypothetical protein
LALAAARHLKFSSTLRRDYLLYRRVKKDFRSMLGRWCTQFACSESAATTAKCALIAVLLAMAVYQG